MHRQGTSDDYTLTADDLNAFNSDTGYYKYALDNAVNFSIGELHVHGLCGTANCTESKNHKNVLWTAIRTEEESCATSRVEVVAHTDSITI